MDFRSPLDSIFGIIGGLPQGHDKPVKHALYNAVAFFLLFITCAASWGLFFILEPFVKPLLWALLVGTVLHPLKRSLKYKFKAWFEMLDDSNTPVILGILLLPINITNDLCEIVGELLLKKIKIIIGACVTIPILLILYCYTPVFVWSLLWQLCLCIYYIVDFKINFTTLPVITVILITYVTTSIFLWKPENNWIFHYASIVIWIIISFFVARQFGRYQMPAFAILQVIIFGGFVSEVYDIYKELNSSGNKISLFQTLLIIVNHQSELDIENEENEKGDIKFDDPDENKFKKNNENIKSFEDNDIKELLKQQSFNILHPPKRDLLKRSLSQPQFFLNPKKLNLLRHKRTSLHFFNKKEKYESKFYLYSVGWACIAMLFWKNKVLLPLLPLPILFYTVKYCGIYIGLWSYINDNIMNLFICVKLWCNERHDALVPVPIRGLYHNIDKFNVFCKTTIKKSIDTLSSCAVIFGLIVFLTCASIFMAFQIYSEGIMMVQMTSNVINQTVVHNPEIRLYLPPAWDETIDSILDNAYQYVREGISKLIKNMMSNEDPIKSQKLEQQVLELWDRLYQSWMSTENTSGPQVTQDAVQVSWDNFIDEFKKSSEMFNLNRMLEFAKQNIGTLMSLSESIWAILKGNIGLILGSISAFLSVILGGGTAVINFIINTIVFLTTLFYLLDSSGDLYKPVQWITNISSGGSRFGHALEGAVNGVFTASFKMAAFYGMWTWFIHNLFSVKIVYLPTAFAIIFGAAPFIGTYWACFPAVLDLWLAQDRTAEAIIFAVFQFIPTYFVDATIYGEIKGGGHPYLTGLAIGGGLFCMGLEGAIIGPILLCCVYVAIDLSSNLFRDTPSQEDLSLQLKL